MDNKNFGAIVLAAGKGSRMKAKNINKVAMSLAGKPIIKHAIELLEKMNIKTIVVVIGYAKASVIDALDQKVIFAEQSKRLGTGHAALCGLKKIPEGIKNVLIINGDDSAFYAGKMIQDLIEKHFSSNAALTFLTVEKDNPENFGRVVRDENGKLIAIFEEKNATSVQKRIKEINAGCYIYTIDFLKKYLPKVKKNSVSKEYYLTDLISIGLENNENVVNMQAGNMAWWGINTKEELEEAERYKKLIRQKKQNKIMKAVILAAGQSSRLYPFAKDEHKSMIKIMGKPFLEYTIEQLEINGIKDLVIVVGKNSNIEEYFSDGNKFGVSIKYVIQPESLGMGNALLLAKDYVDGDFLLLHSYHFDVVGFIKDLIEIQGNNSKIALLVKKREDTFSQGVLRVEGDRVLEVIEKPAEGKEPSKLCIVGIYLISRDFLDELQNTPVEQYQFEKVLSSFAKKNIIKFVEIENDTISLKFPWDLINVKNYLLNNIKKSIDKKAMIAKSAEIIGEVIICEGATVMEGVRIKGPCFIGKNVTVGNNSLLRNGVCIEENSTVGAFMEMKNTLLMKNSKTHSGFIGDSVIGENVRIGAQFSTGNVRLDRETVSVVVKGEKIDSGLKSLGTMIGNGVHIGIKSVTMPGIIIGNSCIVGPSTVVLNNVPDKTKYYTKFAEIVNKI